MRPLIETIYTEGYDPDVSPTLAGFVYFLNTMGEGKQNTIIVKMLARLAREFPESNPREVVIEHLSELLYEYERRLFKQQMGFKGEL
jgi:hypothetical protein